MASWGLCVSESLLLLLICGCLSILAFCIVSSMSFILDWRESFQFSSLSRQEFIWSNSWSRASYSETENIYTTSILYSQYNTSILYSPTRQICEFFLPAMCCSRTTAVGLFFFVCVCLDPHALLYMSLVWRRWLLIGHRTA